MSEPDTYLRRYPPMTEQEFSEIKIDILSLAERAEEEIGASLRTARQHDDRVAVDGDLLNVQTLMEDLISDIGRIRARIGENVR